MSEEAHDLALTATHPCFTRLDRLRRLVVLLEIASDLAKKVDLSWNGTITKPTFDARDKVKEELAIIERSAFESFNNSRQ
jgi:hypothetical protein